MGCCGWRASDRDREPTVPPIPSTRPVPARVIEQRRAEAESALVAATAGEPLCRIEAGGDPTEPKYAEGALAAIAELQRAIRAMPPAGELTAARDLLASWEARQATCADRGVAWSAYCNGGVAELRSVVAELAAGVEGARVER